MIYPTFTSALIHTMAKQELTALNWPSDLQLDYSLRHCQNDGVIFTGTLSGDDLMCIIPRLRARRLLTRTHARKLFTAVRELGVTVRISNVGKGYSHTGTVVIVAEGFPDALEILEKSLLIALTEQYNDLCHSVRLLGYQLTDATHPEEFEERLLYRKTLNIELDAIAIGPSEFGYCDEDEEILSEYISLILDQRARVASLRFRVKCDGQTMAESWASGIVILPGQPPRKWVPLDEIQYVAHEARAAIRSQAEVFRSFLTVA